MTTRYRVECKLQTGVGPSHTRLAAPSSSPRPLGLPWPLFLDGDEDFSRGGSDSLTSIDALKTHRRDQFIGMQSKSSSLCHARAFLSFYLPSFKLNNEPQITELVPPPFPNNAVQPHRCRMGILHSMPQAVNGTTCPIRRTS